MGTKNKLKWALALGVVVVAGVTVGALGYVYKEVKAFDQVFAPGITVEEIPVSGLTYEEALKRITDKFTEIENNKKVIIKKGTQTAEIAGSSLGMQSDIEEVLKVAFATGHSGNIFEKFSIVKNQTDMNLDLSLSETYNEELIKSEVEALQDKFYIAAVDATISRKNGQFVTTNEKTGQKLNVEATTKDIKEALSQAHTGTGEHIDTVEIEATVETIEPKYTTSSFDNIKQVVSSFSTSYNNVDLGRNANLEVAAAKISRTLMPGETFSLAEQLEPFTYGAGYKDANVIVNGKIEKGIGGGVCQVASTLYNAVLLTNLDVTMRQNHSLSVSYVPLGRDATYATGSIDFQFKNNLDAPVIIEGYCQNNNVYVNIYGADSAKPKYEVKFLSEITEEIPAPATKYVDDPTLEAGKEVVETTALDGKRVRLYKLLYDDNGKLVDKVVENNSYYKPRAAVIKRGTKEVTNVVNNTTPKVEEPNASAQTRAITPSTTSSNTQALPMNEWDDSFEVNQE